MDLRLLTFALSMFLAFELGEGEFSLGLNCLLEPKIKLND